MDLEPRISLVGREQFTAEHPVSRWQRYSQHCPAARHLLRTNPTPLGLTAHPPTRYIQSARLDEQNAAGGTE